MMISGPKTLVRESEWMRVFKFHDQETYLFESKFLVDDLRVPPLTVRSRWPNFTPDEKIEFASAFSSQPPRDDDDQKILEFLMDVGPEEVWRTIAKLLPFHPLHDRALEFLLERTEKTAKLRANYYQALESLRGPEAVPALRQHYNQYLNLIAGKDAQNQQLDIWIDYLQCAKTLLILTRDLMFESALEEAKITAPAELRSSAASLLEEAKKARF